MIKHPHSTREYVAWLAAVWKANLEKQKEEGA